MMRRCFWKSWNRRWGLENGGTSRLSEISEHPGKEMKSEGEVSMVRLCLTGGGL